MKIAFVASGKSPTTHPGGLGAYAFNTAKILKSLGYKVYVIGFSDHNEIIQVEGIDLVHVKTPFSFLVSFGLFLITPYLVKAMIQLIEKDQPSEVVVYGAGLWGCSGVSLKKDLVLKNIPCRTFVGYFSTFQHDSWGQVVGAPLKDYGFVPHFLMWAVYLVARIIFKPIEHKMLRESDRVIVHYESTRNILTNEVKGLDSNKIIKLPYYVDLYERSSEVGFASDLIKNSNVPTIGVLCRQDPRKGINTFIKAVKLLKDSNLKFNCLIVGKGIFLEHNKKLAERLGLKNDILFPGFVDSVETVLNSLDVYVLPSVEEGSGAISLLEAMKHGVAIVTTICDGIPEDFINGETGLLVPMGDHVAMAKALEQLIGDRENRLRLAINVKTDYQTRFTFEKMQNGLAELISGTL